MKRMAKYTMFAALVAAGLLVAEGAVAQEVDNRPFYMSSPYGMGFSVGGALTDFTDEDTRGFTSMGGGWEARYILGTRTRIGAEASYVGTANPISGLGGVDGNAILLSNGVEGAARFNFLTRDWQPYMTAGVGWRHYNLTNTDVNNSAVNDSDDAMTVPLGGGIAYRYQGLVVDARGLFRPAAFADFTDERGAVATSRLHSWSANLNLGFEF